MYNAGTQTKVVVVLVLVILAETKPCDVDKSRIDKISTIVGRGVGCIGILL
jgi:hypothetical protein